MRITVGEKAKRYIKENSTDDSIYIFVTKARWWKPYKSSVVMGKPENTNAFNKYLVNEVYVYIQKGLKDNYQGVSINLKDIILKKYLKVGGLRISVV